MTGNVEVKVSELSRYALDWAVAKTEGLKAAIFPGETNYVFIDSRGHGCGPYRPHEYWAQGGLLVSKYAIEFEWITDLTIRAELPACGSFGHGQTHLIAACRAIVASVLGPVVSVPKELCHE